MVELYTVNTVTHSILTYTPVIQVLNVVVCSAACLGFLNYDKGMRHAPYGSGPLASHMSGFNASGLALLTMPLCQWFCCPTIQRMWTAGSYQLDSIKALWRLQAFVLGNPHF